MINRSEALKESRELILRKRYPDIYTAINNAKSPEKLIASLLFAAGYKYVEGVQDEGKTTFLAGNAPEDLNEQIIYSKPDNVLRGKSKDIVEKTYLVLSAIEHELTKTLSQPHELVEQRIKQVCQWAGIDRDFFSTITANWSKV